MAKAKLTTRGISTSTVTSDNLAKGSQLTHNQLDSNFINLRDQTFGIAADDSATIQVGAGDTLYIQGGSNVTTSTDSAGVVTINATGEVTASSTTTFTNKTFDAEGTGNALSNVDVANLKSGVLDTDISSVSGSDDTLASAKAIKTYVDSQVSGVATGQGFKVIGDDSAGVDIPEAGTLYIQGGTNVTTSTDSAGVVTINGAGTATSLTTDGLTIVDNNINGTRSNEHIAIAPNGTGAVFLDSATINVGRASEAASIVSNGTHDLNLVGGDGKAIFITESSSVVKDNAAAFVSGLKYNMFGTGLQADHEAVITSRGLRPLQFRTNGGQSTKYLELLSDTGVHCEGTLAVTEAATLDGVTVSDNTISTNASNSDLEISANGTGIVTLGNGLIDTYSSNSRWQNGVIRVFENLGFVADSQTSSSDRKHLHTTLTNVKFDGANSSNSNVRWRNSYNVLHFDMNNSELTPSGDSKIA